VDDAATESSTMLTGITPDYLSAVGIRLVAGRDFTVRDDSTSEAVAIISESVAQRTFAGRTPIGATLRIHGDTTTTRRVIGVSRDRRMFGLRGERVPVIYAPVSQTGPWPFLGLAVRMPDGSEALTRRVTDAIDAAWPGIRIRRISAMRTDVHESMFTERMAA